MKHRQGGKFTGNHTTVTDLSGVVADIVVSIQHVTKCSLGVINNGIKSAHGNIRVKILDEEGCETSVLLVVRGNTSKQELRVYVEHGRRYDVKLALARILRDRNIAIGFRKEQ